MKGKNNNISSSDLLFEEEVSEKEIINNFSKGSSVIYEYKSKNYFLMMLFIVLILISLFSSLFAFLYMGRDRNNIINNGEIVVNRYSLYVVHSNQYFGGKDISFKEYNSLENAYHYSVNITNKNDIDIDYNVVLDNSFSENDNVDMSKINFSLYNSNVLINSGVLENKDKINLSNIRVKSNDIDQLNLKIWSSDVNQDIKFSFKIEIIV